MHILKIVIICLFSLKGFSLPTHSESPPKYIFHGQTLDFADLYLQINKDEKKEAIIRTSIISAAKFEELDQAFKSVRFYKEIEELAYQADYSEKIRRSIGYAFLKLSEHFTDKSNFYITESRKFSKPGEISLSSFSSETKKRYLKKRLDQTGFPILHFFDSPKYILLNSRQIPMKDWVSLKLPKGVYRLSVISTHHKAFHFQGDFSSFTDSDIKNPPIDFGNCQSPKVPHAKFMAHDFEIMISDQCRFKYANRVFTQINSDFHIISEVNKTAEEKKTNQKAATNQEWQKNANIPKNINSYLSKNKPIVTPNNLNRYKEIKAQQSSFDSKSKSLDSGRKKFWMALGVVALGLVIHDNSQSSKTFVYQ